MNFGFEYYISYLQMKHEFRQYRPINRQGYEQTKIYI